MKSLPYCLLRKHSLSRPKGCRGTHLNNHEIQSDTTFADDINRRNIKTIQLYKIKTFAYLSRGLQNSSYVFIDNVYTLNQLFN